MTTQNHSEATPLFHLLQEDAKPSSRNFSSGAKPIQVGSLNHSVIWIENCSSPLDNVDFEDPRVLGSLLPLGLVCLMVILGNIMVITAVRITHKLRGATNLFIVSLAWADLMLGIVVLPFSAMYEVFKMWLFGQVWCSIWLAVDVWMCTASILHLVVISLDRYIAVTHPITYPNLMTSKKAKLLIAGAWILSFVICFPPLVGWNDKDDGSGMFDLNKTQVYEDPDEVLAILERCNPQCMLNQEPGYVIYSAVGSFYAPMLVMMFFNWRIYRTARKTTKAIRQGWTRVKGVSDGEEVGLGIHRGGGAASRGNKANGSTFNSGMSSRRTSSRRPSTAYIGQNGLAVKDVEVVTALVRSARPSICQPPASPRIPAKPTRIAAAADQSSPMPRSASSVLISNKSMGEPPRSPSHQSFTSTNNASAGLHNSRGKSKSMANVRHSSTCNTNNTLQVPSGNSLYEEKANHSHVIVNNYSNHPKVSHHQPCPNHVGGKTFAEIGTQTLPKPKVKAEKADEDVTGCAAKMKQRFRIGKSREEASDPEKDSIGSAPVKPRSCFRCHPRRWRHQACCFRSKTGATQKSSFRARITRDQAAEADNISDPGSLLNASTDELHVHPLGGVASMISSVVSHTANMAATTAGGRIVQPPRSTFGKRNIKNQVRRFRMETKAAKTLGIIVGCFICCWFPFFTMYLVTAFCADCIPKLVFSIIFWLGYCNSAINPFIYAAFSRDFRGAFKKIICKALCRRSHEPPRGIFMALHPRNVTLGAAVAVAGATTAANVNSAVTVGQTSTNSN